MRRRILLLEHTAAADDARSALAAVAPGMIVMRLEAGLGGVWSEYSGENEVIRVGYPAGSPHACFRPLEPKRGTETCASVALGRTVFGRRVSDVVVRERPLAAVAAQALAGHDVRCWYAAAPARPEDFERAANAAPAAHADALAKAIRRAMDATE